jgi:hypothetical protein
MNVDAPLPFSDHHFHHVIAISVLQAVTNPVATCREVWRILKPGGSLVVLHVPKPAYHDLPFVEEVRLRRRYLKRKTALNSALLALKSWGERVGGTRYWTTSQLQSMLEAQHYHIQSLEVGPPILVVANKPSQQPKGSGKGGSQLNVCTAFASQPAHTADRFASTRSWLFEGQKRPKCRLAQMVAVPLNANPLGCFRRT